MSKKFGAIFDDSSFPVFNFSFIFVEKMSSKSAESDKREFFVFNSILLTNEPQIGRRPIKGGIIF
jgi:hypothetical protein